MVLLMYAVKERAFVTELIWKTTHFLKWLDFIIRYDKIIQKNEDTERRTEK